MNNSTVGVLDSILRAAGAKKYIEHFRSHDIDASMLSILTEEDLILLGLEENTIRENLLSHCKHLQIHTEKKINLLVDKEYACLVLNQIYNQLNVHRANLACALVRKDIAMCNEQLSKVSASLLKSVESLDDEIKSFEKMVFPPRKKQKNLVMILLASAPITIILAYVLCKSAKQMIF